MFTAKNMSHLVVSLFCFAFCAWQAAQVKLNLDMLKAASPAGSGYQPGDYDKPEAEDAVAGNIAASVLFGLAGAVAFSGMFYKQSGSGSGSM